MLAQIKEITDKYEILDKIGEGGMGAIYTVRHRLLDEVRVIKTIRPGIGERDGVQQRFRREAQVAAKLRHPHIASIYDFSVLPDGTAYIVMEYIVGENLNAYYRSGHTLHPEQVLHFGKQVLDALRYLHERSFIHRDVSTDNLMLTRDVHGSPAVKLIDLGLAKSLDQTGFKTHTGALMGKARYVSPEQISHGSGAAVIDVRSDLYSFGIVLYELLTGSLPITGEDQVSLIAGHLYLAPKSFEVTDPENRIPPRLRRVLLKTLEKNPDDRFASAIELEQALDEAAEEMTPVVPVSTGAGTVSVEAAASPQRTSVMSPAETAAFRITDGGTAGNPPDRSASPAPPPVPIDEWGEPSPSPATGPAAPATGPRHRHRLIAVGAVVLVVVTVLVVAGLNRGRARPSALEPAASAPASGLFFGSYHALVIGIDAYETWPHLETAVNDARAVSRLLEVRYGFRVELLPNPTRDEIVDAVEETAERLTSRDNLLIYYAGHGKVENMSEYWIPVDGDLDNTANWISTRYRISDAIDRSAAQHVLVVADSCYSGAGGDLSEPGIPQPGNRVEHLRDLLGRSSRLVLASGSNEPVLDRGGGTHSVFARALLDVLTTNDEIVEVSRLFERIRELVPASVEAYGVEQTPSLAPIPLARRDQGGEFVFRPVSAS